MTIQLKLYLKRKFLRKQKKGNEDLLEEINSRTELLIAETKNKLWNSLISFVIKPLVSGILGFMMFFAVIILTKSLGCCVGTIENFSIESEDFYLSFLGFVLVFLIKFLENFREKEN